MKLGNSDRTNCIWMVCVCVCVQVTTSYFLDLTVEDSGTFHRTRFNPKWSDLFANANTLKWTIMGPSFLSWFWQDLTTPICISRFLPLSNMTLMRRCRVSACSSRPWSGWKVRCKMGTLPVKGQRKQIWWATQLSWCKLIRKIQYTWNAIVFIVYLE